MKVIVDTCVWSLALRRYVPGEDHIIIELRELIYEARVQMIGPVRQEILSGIRSNKQFGHVRAHLSAFPDLHLQSSIYERAAEFFNINRNKGVQGSNTDYLICAVSEIHGMPIFTTDKDFINFKQNIDITLHACGKRTDNDEK